MSCLKDSSLHSSLQQPAFDLVQTILVSDAAALITSMLNCSTASSIGKSICIELDDEEEDNDLPFTQVIEGKNMSCWSEFSAQSQITSQEYREWMCVPMLWIDVLVDIDPPLLPISFSKAVLWARSRFPMVEPENSAEVALDVRGWLSSSAAEISSTFGWKLPTGSDDGGGKESKNSIRLITMCLPLLKTFKRFVACLYFFLHLLLYSDVCYMFSSCYLYWETHVSSEMQVLMLSVCLQVNCTFFGANGARGTSKAMDLGTEDG